jgi:hypothetical protein
MRHHFILAMSIPVLLLGLRAFAADEARSPDVTEAPPRGDFLVLPLHVHILTAKDRPEIDCKLTDADIDRIVSKINRVWGKAGIAFRIESLLREPAENLAKFDEMKDLAGRGAFGVYRVLTPQATRALPGLHVYYLHELPVNGVYVGANTCFVKETAALRKVEGGIDEPIPRVSSHEIGHALSLPHRQDKTNLMASGTTGTVLNEAEVAHARAAAKKMAGVMTADECEAAARAAEKKGDAESAKRLRAALAAAGHG